MIVVTECSGVQHPMISMRFFPVENIKVSLQSGKILTEVAYASCYAVHLALFETVNAFCPYKCSEYHLFRCDIQVCFWMKETDSMLWPCVVNRRTFNCVIDYGNRLALIWDWNKNGINQRTKTAEIGPNAINSGMRT